MEALCRSQLKMKSKHFFFFYIFVEFGLWRCVILKLSEEGLKKKKSHLNLLCLISECKVKSLSMKCVYECASVDGLVSLWGN